MEKLNENKILEAAEITIAYNPKVKPSNRFRITSSRDAEQVLRQYWNADTLELFEEFKLLLLNRANKVLGIFNVSKGGISGTVADPKLIFMIALKTAASGIILAHNHPSGNLTPSHADIELTKKLKNAGAFLEIQVLDHVILTGEKYFSFADEGLL